MNNSIGVAILAGGQGKRLKITEAKPLLPLLGRRMIDYPIEEARSFATEHGLVSVFGVVVGHLKDEVQSYLQQRYIDSGLLPQLSFPHQVAQLGTGDALRTYFEKTPRAKETDYTLVMCADVPLIRKKELNLLYQEFKKNSDLIGVAATFEVDNPFGYGRIIRTGKGFHIVEEKHVDKFTSEIKEVNSSLYIFKTSFVLENLSKIVMNAHAGEFYLTDLFQDDTFAQAVKFAESHRFLGVNTLEQHEEVLKCLLKEKVAQLRDCGIRFLDPKSVYIDWDVQAEGQALIYPNVCLEGSVHIGKNVQIESGVVIKNSKIEEGAVIKAYSYMEKSIIHKGATIGPFAHLRPGSDIGEGCKVGNYVEIKQSKLQKGAKVSHLSYVGDAEIGENTNLGCGFITCNYDGVNKHKTKIGRNAFIGSDCQIVAPIEIGNDAFVAAGSTITQSIPDGAFAIARSRQETKNGMAKKFLFRSKKEDK